MSANIELKREKLTVANLERVYMKKQSRELYTALEEADFHWCIDEVKQVEKMWNKGICITDIAEYFNRSSLETFLLILDRLEKGKIKARKGSIFGNGNGK